MAASPAFAATPHAGAVITPATLDTSLTAPTNVATLFSAGASGSRVDTIRITQVASSASAGIVNIFLFDGVTYHLLDNFSFGVVTLSATSEAQPVDLYYQNLVFATGWSLRVTVTSTGGQSAFKVIAFGGDF
jgi:hypothetical protein